MEQKPMRLIFLLVSVAILAMCLQRITLPMGHGDATSYMKMAENPGTLINPPWGYRIALPYCAALLTQFSTLPLILSFGILQTNLFAAFLTLLFLWISDELKLGIFTAGLAAILFAFSYPGIYNLHNVVHVGLGEHLFILLCLIALCNRRIALLCLVMFASGFVKESVGLLMVPTSFVHLLITRKWYTAFLQTTLIGIAFLIPFFLLRSGIMFESSNINSYTSFYSWEEIKACYLLSGGITGIISKLALYYGPLGILAAAGFLLTPHHKKGLITLPILAALQIALASDVMRMFGTSIPVLIMFAAHGLRRIDRGHAALLCSLAAFHFLCINHGFGQYASFVLSTALSLPLLWLNRAAFFNNDEEPASMIHNGSGD